MSIMNSDFNILFTSVGRRVALIKHFRNTLKTLNLHGQVMGVDVSDMSSAFHIVDKAFDICEIENPRYIEYLTDICMNERIKLLFPLIDTDLLILSQHIDAFNSVGTNVVISDPSIIEIARNKFNTYHFFVANNIPTPRVFEIDDVLSGKASLPLFIKPLDGNASKGAYKINDMGDLDFYKDRVQRPILMEYVDGTEYTLDILYDFSGTLRCVVPRKRIEVRAGEVSKGVVVDTPEIVEAGWRVGRLLKGCRGCINIQCICASDGTTKFIEINPRFGGGAPLSIKAGADFPLWIIQMFRGKDPGDISTAFRRNVYMLRYDDAVFLDGNKRRKQAVMVFGAGGHGKVVIDALELKGEYYVDCVLDDKNKPDSFFDYPLLGSMKDLEKVIARGVRHAIVAVGDPFVRDLNSKKLIAAGFQLIKVIHPESVISRNVKIGNGSVVFAKAVLNSGTSIGRNCIVNTGALIEHDNSIGDNVHVSPKAVLGGEVKVGDNTHIGIGAVVINGLSIGSNTIIGAGSVVTRDVPDNVIAYGIPARVRRNRN